MKNTTKNNGVRNKVLGVFVSLLFCTSSSFSQQDFPFQIGEQLDFVVYYKYGVVMTKAGSAQYTIKDHALNEKPTIRTSLTFKTAGVVDAAYRVKDTLYSHFTPELIPVLHRKHLNEGKTKYIDEIEFKKFSEKFTSVQSRRIRDGNMKFDTLLTANSLGYDMLGVFTFVRTLDYSDLKTGDKFVLTSFVGRDAVPLHIRYMGQAILDKGTVKYKTLKFGIDIIDTAFTEPKNAMEIWISDDQNHIPVKLKAKLKIGAAEAELTSVKNLKYPFDSRIEIPQ